MLRALHVWEILLVLTTVATAILGWGSVRRSRSGKPAWLHGQRVADATAKLCGVGTAAIVTVALFMEQGNDVAATCAAAGQYAGICTVLAALSLFGAFCLTGVALFNGMASLKVDRILGAGAFEHPRYEARPTKKQYWASTPAAQTVVIPSERDHTDEVMVAKSLHCVRTIQVRHIKEAVKMAAEQGIMNGTVAVPCEMAISVGDTMTAASQADTQKGLDALYEQAELARTTVAR